jgi:uncharacterized protein (DUF983 family)
VSEVVALNSTLDQELLALMRGASLECPVCGEFVMHVRGGIVCAECGAGFETTAKSRLQLGLQAG